MDLSGINLPEGEDLSVKEVRRGVYKVDNAYEGTVEYFEGEPIQIKPSEECTVAGEPPVVDTLSVEPPAETTQPKVDQAED